MDGEIGQQCGKPCIERTGKPAAEQAIDQYFARNAIAIGNCLALPGRTRIAGGISGGFQRRDKGNCKPPAAQHLGDHIAIAAIVARAA